MAQHFTETPLLNEEQRQITIGVLALQGDFAEHLRSLQLAGATAVEVRYPEQLQRIDGLIIPGGESTTIIKLLDRYCFGPRLRQELQNGLALWGTCAGLIVVATHLVDPYPKPLGLLDITVARNWFGRQINSFEASLQVPILGKDPFRGVFIRAPGILHVGNSVDVLATLPNENQPVAVRSKNFLGTIFHPELTIDTRFHKLFISMARNRIHKSTTTSK